MPSHKFGCRYKLGEAIKMLYEDSDIDESYKDMFEDLQACQTR